MTVITRERQNHGGAGSAQVWRCVECDCFHVLAGQALLTFTPNEFAAFTEEIAECYCVQMPVSKDLEKGLPQWQNASCLGGGVDSGDGA